MKNALKLAAVLLALAQCASALEVSAPVSVKGAAKADFDLSGITLKGVTWEKGAVVLPVTENKGRTYSDVKLNSKGLYAKLEACFKKGCPAKEAAPAKAEVARDTAAVSAAVKAAAPKMPVLKIEDFKLLKSKVRLANAEVSFDGELVVVMGVMASAKEEGTFWVAFPDSVEFRDPAFKAAVESFVIQSWAKKSK